MRRYSGPGDRRYPVHHGGDMVGFHSDMMWFPEHDVGAVILTNADPGWMVRGPFLRKLLEELFDGRNEAESRLEAGAQEVHARLAAERKRLTVPADPADAATLAPRHQNGVVSRRAARIHVHRDALSARGEAPWRMTSDSR